METLNIPNPLNYDDITLEYAINYWLCDQNKMEVLAAYIEWGGKPGMMLVSSFKYIPDGIPDPGNLEENERDKTIVKKWLMNSAGVRAGELEWITLVDDRSITLNGIRPRRVVFRRSKKTPAQHMAELKEAVRKRELELSKRNNY